MMQFIATLRLPQVDMNAFRAALDEKLIRATTQGAVVWLTKVIEESTPRVGMPVWSAASRATFQPLASQVEFAMSYTPTSVSGKADRIDVGIGASPGDNGTFERGETPGLYSFTYSTTLPHLIVNEYHNANTFRKGNRTFHLTDPGPYHFQEKGKAAFLKHASEISLPDVPIFVHTTQSIG